MPTTTKKRTSVAADVFDAAAAASAAQSAVDALTSASAAQTVHMLAPTVLHPHPRNPRKSFGDLTELQQSIAANGILQPVTAVPHPDLPGEYRILLGHCRTECARLLELPFVPVMVRTDLDEAAQLEAMLVENIQRADLTVIEEGAGYQGLLDLGVKRTVIAQHTGRAVSTVTQRVKIASLPEAFHPAVVEKQVTLEEAAEFADLPGTHDAVFMAALKSLDKGESPAHVIGKAVTKSRHQALVDRATAMAAKVGFEFRMGSFYDTKVEKISLTALGWTAAEHHATGCDGGVIFGASWTINADDVDGLGTLGCLKPDNHVDRVTEVNEQRAQANAAASVESPEQAEKRAAREKLSADLGEARLSRARFLAGLLADPIDPKILAVLSTFACTFIGWGYQSYTLETIIPKSAPELLNGVGPVGRLVLVGLTTPADHVPFDAWQFERGSQDDAHMVKVRAGALRFLKILAAVGYELTEVEADVVATYKAIDAKPEPDVEPDADEADAS